MSKHRVLSFKPQLRLEWRGQDGQNETEQSDHSASLGDSITSSTQIRFSVHTGLLPRFEQRQERWALAWAIESVPKRPSAKPVRTPGCLHCDQTGVSVLR